MDVETQNTCLDQQLETQLAANTVVLVPKEGEHGEEPVNRLIAQLSRRKAGTRGIIQGTQITVTRLK